MATLNTATKTKPMTNKPVAPKKIEGWSLLVDAPIGSYKEGDTLTTVRHVADFVRQWVAEHIKLKTDGADEIAEKIAAVKDDAVVAVVRTADFEPPFAEGESKVTRMLQALADATFATHDDSSISPLQTVATTVVQTLAWRMGSLIDEAANKHMTRAIEGKRDELAGPAWLESDLRRLLGHIGEDGTPIADAKPGQVHAQSCLRLFPIIGSVYTGNKHDKAPFGYSVPKRGDKNAKGEPLPDYQGPWHKYKGGNQTTVIDAVMEFVRKEPGENGGAFWDDRLNCIRSLTGKVPSEVAGSRERHPDLYSNAKGHNEYLMRQKGEASFELTRRYGMHVKAFRLLQQRFAFEKRWNNNITFRLYDTQADAATIARSTAPWVLVEYSTVDGERTAHPSRAISTSKLLSINPARWPANTTVATILAPAPRKTAETNKDGTVAGSTPAKIKTAAGFADTISNIADYAMVEENVANVNAAIRNGTPTMSGGALASLIVRVGAFCNLLMTDEIVALANQHDKTALKSQLIAGAEKQAA